jgi:hypothetical protein
MAQVAEHLPSKHETLNSNPRTVKKKFLLMKLSNIHKNSGNSQMQWCTPIDPAIQRLRQEDPLSTEVRGQHNEALSQKKKKRRKDSIQNTL